jgi:hypothetical protein
MGEENRISTDLISGETDILRKTWRAAVERVVDASPLFSLLSDPDPATVLFAPTWRPCLQALEWIHAGSRGVNQLTLHPAIAYIDNNIHSSAIPTRT